MNHATKIVATLGPASSSPEVLERLILAGVNVVRLNFSHGSTAEHRTRAELVRAIAEACKRDVGLLVDLQGPKIRIGKFAQGSITLQTGDRFRFDIHCELGDQSQVGLDYKELVHDVKPGDTLVLNDGRMSMRVEATSASTIDAQVLVGGVLSDRKGINRLGGGLSAAALTAKDMDDIRTAADLAADFLAVSFPKNSSDMYMARELMRACGSKAHTVAKIERYEAIDNLEDILKASELAREFNKFTITATQMMESMIDSPVPTRAEVSDVANAVIDGTDAVMLSAESATGKYPVETVEAMVRICVEAEKSHRVSLDTEFLNRTFTRIDQSIAMSALFVAHHMQIKAIAALTQSGSTALWMSRLNAGVPIYALTPEEGSRRRMTIYRDVRPMLSRYEAFDRDALLRACLNQLLEAGVVEQGDLIVLTIGEPIGKAGGTNTLKLVRVGEH
ncbi:MAG: pyruvate kinase [Betaproteobacteria bacterium]|nr:pyruvate kinase [Betaproteobacteria bacterium]